MIHTIIFSHNRAIQLEVLLQSLKQYDCNNVLQVSVLYSFSDDSFKNGYEKLKISFREVNWIEEVKHTSKFVSPLLPLYWHNYYWWFRYKWAKNKSSHFRRQLLELIGTTTCGAVMFLTDDSMFFDSIHFPDQVFKKILKNPFEYSFSFRHGSNISGGEYKEADGSLSCNIYKKGILPEWSYPFSIDGHVYSVEFIKKVLVKLWFKNPNTLEGNTACYIGENHMIPTLYFNSKSCLVGFELNRVQTVHANNSLDINPAYLNSLFNNGYSMRIRFDEELNNLYRPEKFSVEVSNQLEVISVVDRL